MRYIFNNFIAEILYTLSAKNACRGLSKKITFIVGVLEVSPTKNEYCDVLDFSIYFEENQGVLDYEFVPGIITRDDVCCRYILYWDYLSL